MNTIVHLFGDWKWTGPAEPVLELCSEIKKLGYDIILLCKNPPPSANVSLYEKAKSTGICVLTTPQPENILQFCSFLRSHRVEILHTHLSHDHWVGGISARLAGKDIKIIRTNHKGISINNNVANIVLLRLFTDGYITFSYCSFKKDLETFGFAKTKMWHLPIGMSSDKFRTNKYSKSVTLQRFNVAEDNFVVGLVARMQRHRRIDVFLKGIKLAVKEADNIRVLMIGRGTHINEIAIEPTKKLGLQNHVIFTRYLTSDYLAALSSIDVLVYLVPGSDGTCRTIREAMALGKPVIGARRGIIPEIIDDGITGIVIDDTPENIKSAILKLVKDKKLAEEMGRKGQEKTNLYSIETQAKRMIEIYQQVLQK